MKIADIGLTDVVIDTNVLSHADNPASNNQASALALLSWMSTSSIHWVLDDNGKHQPDPTTSLLYHEYQQTLAPQGLAIQIFTACLMNKRVRFSQRPTQVVRDEIRKLIAKNKKDQVVLGAACGSESKTLFTNDFNDFSDKVRDHVQKKLSVDIFRSTEVDCSSAT